VRRVDDCQLLEPLVAALGRQPGDRTAPIMADQRETVQPERIGKREDVVD
jgi:hypothetical protein